MVGSVNFTFLRNKSADITRYGYAVCRAGIIFFRFGKEFSACAENIQAVLIVNDSDNIAAVLGRRHIGEVEHIGF